VANYPPYQQPSPYSPVPAYVVSRPSSGMATAAMVLGIVGLFSCGLTSILAVIFGHVAEVHTRDARQAGRGQAVAGLVLGYLVLAPALIFLGLALVGAVTLPFAGMASQH
jgi:Domain of unknown function (DUF4190)